MNLHYAFLLLLVFTTGCASMGPSKNKERADAYLQIGSAHLAKGNYPMALTNLLEAVRLDPSNPVGRNNLGLAYFVRGRYDLAEVQLKEAVSLNSNYTDARNNLGRTYTEQKKFDKAIEQLSIAVKDLTYPQPYKLYSNLGYAYFQHRDFKNAKGYLYEAVKMNREDCYALSYYGRTLFELKEFEASAQTLDQSIRLCAAQRFDEPYYFAGLSYLKIQRREQAEARFDEIIKLYPGSEYAKKSKKILERLR